MLGLYHLVLLLLRFLLQFELPAVERFAGGARDGGSREGSRVAADDVERRRDVIGAPRSRRETVHVFLTRDKKAVRVVALDGNRLAVLDVSLVAKRRENKRAHEFGTTHVESRER